MTIKKSKKKSLKWHQAELSSLISLDFRAKRVKRFMSTKGRKYIKNENYIDLFIITFSRFIIIKSYKDQWPLERALKVLLNAAKLIFLVETVWILHQNEYTWMWKCWKIKLLESLQNSFYKIVYKSFVYVFPIDHQGYMVPKGPLLNVCAKMYDFV